MRRPMTDAEREAMNVRIFGVPDFDWPEPNKTVGQLISELMAFDPKLPVRLALGEDHTARPLRYAQNRWATPVADGEVQPFRPTEITDEMRVDLWMDSDVAPDAWVPCVVLS